MGVGIMRFAITSSIRNFKFLGYRAWLYLNEELLLKGKMIAETELVYSEKELSLVNLVGRAHREWEQAKAFFEEAAEPDLIDHAIYAVEAAERKYIYLLKLAQKEKQIDESLYQLRENGLA